MIIASTQIKKAPGRVQTSEDCTALQSSNSLGNPPNIQLIGLTTKQAPVKALEAMIRSSWYLKVSNPQGILNRSTNKITVHSAQISNTLENMELTKSPIINPRTKLIIQLHAPTKNTETPISLVAPYPNKQDTNSSNRKDEYIVKFDELGLMKSVSSEPKAIMLIRNTARKTVISTADLPQKSRQNPSRNITTPKNTGWSWKTFQKLEIQSTGQPYTDQPYISSFCSYSSTSYYETQKSFLAEHLICISVFLMLMFATGSVCKVKVSVLSPSSLSQLVLKYCDEEFDEYRSHLYLRAEGVVDSGTGKGVTTKENAGAYYGHSAGMNPKQKLKYITLSLSTILQGVAISRQVKVNSLSSVLNVQTLLVDIVVAMQIRQANASKPNCFIAKIIN